MFSKETISEIAAVARSHNHEAAALLAVADVESGGIAFADISGRREPLIRFEGHYFDARLSADDRETARALGLAAPRAGRIANPQTQAGRWQLLAKASAIDRSAAYESTSWGLGQVMGAHWKMLGYASVDELVHEARSGASGQARLMAGYIAKAGLARALRDHDWAAFARGYNGPSYTKNRYDTKMAAAWRRYDAMLGDAGQAELLRLGSSGSPVENLQTLLNGSGYDLTVDGLYGRATRRAVVDLQRRSGMVVDGVAGPATIRLLQNQQPATPRPAGMLEAFRDLLSRRR